ncbi:MAG: Ku protein [Polyangia bacterium]
MAAHGVWNGTISFGLVTIPVSLRGAVEEHDLKFSMLDQRDLAPVGYKHINKNTQRSVAWEDIVKGYEYDKGSYVILSPEDFEKANVKANRVLEIEDFVRADQIDPLYFDKPYYVVPQKQGAKAYHLLREALARTGKVGIGRVVMHTRYRLVALIPLDDVLILEILRFAHEIRPTRDLEMPETEDGERLSEREIGMAEQLIEGMTSEWRPAQYKDTYHDDLLRLIEKKIKQGDTAEIEPYNEPAPEGGARGRVHDLLPLLQASLEASRRRLGHEPAPEGESVPRGTAHQRRTASRAPARRSRQPSH